MKKLLQTLAAFVLGSAAAFAQVSAPVLPTAATFNPGPAQNEDFKILSTTNLTINVTFDVTPSVPATAMLVTGNGFGMDMKTFEQTQASSVFQIPLTRESWGIPYNQNFYLQLVITFMDGEDYILNADGEPVMFQAAYITPDTGAAECVATFPSQQNINNELYTLQQAYQQGSVALYFSKPLDENINPSGTLTLLDTTGEGLTEYPLPLVFSDGDWSDMDGLYVVNFTFVPDEDVDVADIAKLKYTFSGFTANGATVTVPDIVLIPKVTPTPVALHPAKKSRLASDLATSVDGVKVYNLQGVLVKDNASAEDIRQLPAGLYIVNGEKVVVK